MRPGADGDGHPPRPFLVRARPQVLRSQPSPRMMNNPYPAVSHSHAAGRALARVSARSGNAESSASNGLVLSSHEEHIVIGRH